MKTIAMLAALAAAAMPHGALGGAKLQAARNMGLQNAEAPKANDSAVKLFVFYPTNAPAQRQQFGPHVLDVALGGLPVGKRRPLIILSHGTTGSAFDSINLVEALVRAGFVVAALEHSNDNYRDRSRSFAPGNVAARAGQVSATIDYMLRNWSGRAGIDPSRIGIFGYSAGGTTALVVGGGKFDWQGILAQCQSRPEVYGCQSGRAQAANPDGPRPAEISAPDPRVKAIVAAVPALSPGFAPDGLKAVRRPVQLWVAEEDRVIADAGSLRMMFSRKPDYHLVANAGHTSLLAPCSESMKKSLGWLCSDPNGFDRAAFQQDFVKTVIAFFAAKLR